MDINTKHNRVTIDGGEMSVRYATEISRVIKTVYYIVLMSYLVFFIFRRFSGVFIPDWINFSWVILFFTTVLLFLSDRIIARYGKNKNEHILVSEITTIKLQAGHKEISAILYSGARRLKTLTFISKEQAAAFITAMKEVHPDLEWIK